MNFIFMTATLCITIVLALALGIAGGYVAILGILHAMNRNRAQKAAPVLVATTPAGD